MACVHLLQLGWESMLMLMSAIQDPSIRSRAWKLFLNIHQSTTSASARIGQGGLMDMNEYLRLVSLGPSSVSSKSGSRNSIQSVDLFLTILPKLDSQERYLPNASDRYKLQIHSQRRDVDSIIRMFRMEKRRKEGNEG